MCVFKKLTCVLVFWWESSLIVVDFCIRMFSLSIHWYFLYLSLSCLVCYEGQKCDEVIMQKCLKQEKKRSMFRVANHEIKQSPSSSSSSKFYLWTHFLENLKYELILYPLMSVNSQKKIKSVYMQLIVGVHALQFEVILMVGSYYLTWSNWSWSLTKNKSLRSNRLEERENKLASSVPKTLAYVERFQD